MSDDDTTDLEEFELSAPQKLTKPISVAVLGILNKLGSKSSYFPKGTNRKEEENIQREKLRKYFHAAFYDRSKFYLPPFVLIIVLAIVDGCFGLFGLHLQAYGLLLDALGAVIIALGLFRGLSEIKRDAPSYSTGAQYGGTMYWEPEALSATVRDTVNGIYGTTFLFIGFSIQFIAISGITIGAC